MSYFILAVFLPWWFLAINAVQSSVGGVDDQTYLESDALAYMPASTDTFVLVSESPRVNRSPLRDISSLASISQKGMWPSSEELESKSEISVGRQSVAARCKSTTHPGFMGWSCEATGSICFGDERKYPTCRSLTELSAFKCDCPPDAQEETELVAEEEMEKNESDRRVGKNDTRKHAVVMKNGSDRRVDEERTRKKEVEEKNESDRRVDEEGKRKEEALEKNENDQGIDKKSKRKKEVVDKNESDQGVDEKGKGKRKAKPRGRPSQPTRARPSRRDRWRRRFGKPAARRPVLEPPVLHDEKFCSKDEFQQDEVTCKSTDGCAWFQSPSPNKSGCHAWKNSEFCTMLDRRWCNSRDAYVKRWKKTIDGARIHVIRYCKTGCFPGEVHEDCRLSRVQENEQECLQQGCSWHVSPSMLYSGCRDWEDSFYCSMMPDRYTCVKSTVTHGTQRKKGKLVRWSMARCIWLGGRCHMPDGPTYWDMETLHLDQWRRYGVPEKPTQQDDYD